MPYSKTPVVNTYETKRVNFISNPQQRSGNGNKDFRLVNMMTDVVNSPIGDQKKYYIKSRPGMNVAYTTQTGEGRGIYYWVVGGVGYAMAAVGNKVYSNGTAVLTLATSTGKVGFTEFVSSTGTVTLILLDGTNGYVFSSPTTPVQISSAAQPVWVASTAYSINQVVRPTTDNGLIYRCTTAGTSSGTEPTWPTTGGVTVNDGSVVWTSEVFAFPSPHLPTPIFLDAYLFVAKVGSEDIYNSDLDNPNAWTAGNFISAEMYPDNIVGLSKNNNFLYAVGSSSVEYFYDAANATGSPLARQAPAVQQFGSAAIGTIVQTEKEVIFIGETNDGGHTVWTIDGFKETEIGIQAVKSALLEADGYVATARAFAIRTAGQKLYVISLPNRTLVYSFDTKMWSEWQTGTGAFTGIYASDGPNGSAYILDGANGNVYIMDEDKFTDAGTPITCSVTSAKLDFDTINRKWMYRLSIIGDVPDDTLVDTAVSVCWSDDDYKTFSTPRTLTFTGDLPAIYQLGQFRRRALKLSYSLPHLLRIEAIECDINKGSS